MTATCPPGRMIAVVGPSGVGKDSVMAGIMDALPDLHLVKRTITRPAGLGGEDYEAVSDATFQAMVTTGGFCVHWGAHGLFYGIPAEVEVATASGQDCLANFSRGALRQAAVVFPRLVVLNLTATPQTLARRLSARGREAPDQIAARLSKAVKPLPGGLSLVTVSNDGPLDQTVTHALAALQPVRA